MSIPERRVLAEILGAIENLRLWIEHPSHGAVCDRLVRASLSIAHQELVAGEVSECCEKWRGMLASSRCVRGCGDLAFVDVMATDVKPTFCPECGREL